MKTLKKEEIVNSILTNTMDEYQSLLCFAPAWFKCSSKHLKIGIFQHL